MGSRLAQYIETNHGNLYHDETKTFGFKLAIIGHAYHVTHSNSFRVFHGNQRQAKLLRQLEKASSEHAFLSLIAILKSLPKEGELSKALIACISLQDVNSLGLHSFPQETLKPRQGETRPKNHNEGCYYYAIRRYRFRGGYKNSDIADILQNFHLKHAKKPLNYVEERNSKLFIISTHSEDCEKLGAALASIGHNYLKKHPKSASFWQLCHRHSHQKQALLLRQLEGVTPDEAIQRCADILLSIKNGELSKSIWSCLDEPGNESHKSAIKAYIEMPARKKLISA